MSLKIRTFLAADHEAAMALWNHCEGIGLSAADSSCAIRQFLEKNPHTCFVIEEDGQIIGTVLGGSDGRRGYLYHLAVDPQQRQRGIGKQLVDACMDAMKEIGIQKCHLMVIDSNLSGQAFWEHNGWQRRQDIVLMSKDVVQVKEAGKC